MDDNDQPTTVTPHPSKAAWALLAVGSGAGLLGLGALHHLLEPALDHFFSTDRGDFVRRMFAESRGVPYSYGGGHYPGATWPRGGPGIRGGIGWDCSGWVYAVTSQANPKPKFPIPNAAVGEIWKSAGYPLNNGFGAKAGDLIFWGYPWRPLHIGFVAGPNLAYSELGQGPAINGDHPDQCVKEHSWAGVGLPMLGTASW